MIKQLIILMIVVSGLCNCTIKAQSEKRKELINKVITAIEQYDTTQLKELLDSSCFSFWGKEDVWNKVEYAHNRFKVCNALIIDSSIKINKKLPHFEEYIIPFCRDKDGKIIEDSFDLLLTFSDFLNDKIKNFNIDIYREPKPTVAPLSGTNR